MKTLIGSLMKFGSYFLLLVASSSVWAIDEPPVNLALLARRYRPAGQLLELFGLFDDQHLLRVARALP